MTYAVVNNNRVTGFVQDFQVGTAKPEGQLIEITEAYFQQLWYGCMRDGCGAYWDIENDQIRPRPMMQGATIDKMQIAADETDETTVSDLPEGADVYVNDVLVSSAAAGGANHKVSVGSPGSITIKVSLFPYVSKHFIVEALEVEEPEPEPEPQIDPEVENYRLDGETDAQLKGRLLDQIDDLQSKQAAGTATEEDILLYQTLFKIQFKLSDI